MPGWGHKRGKKDGGELVEEKKKKGGEGGRTWGTSGFPQRRPGLPSVLYTECGTTMVGPDEKMGLRVRCRSGARPVAGRGPISPKQSFSLDLNGFRARNRLVVFFWAVLAVTLGEAYHLFLTYVHTHFKSVYGSFWRLVR